TTVDDNIYARVGNGWVQVGGAAVQIDVDPNGNAWVVNRIHEIYRWNGGGWTFVPGWAFDVGIGARGDVGVTGGSSSSGTYGDSIFRWNGSGWTQVAGSAINISSGANNDPVVRNRLTDIYRWGN